MAGASAAAPIHYDEAARGDLPDTPVVSLGAMGVGRNIVAGTETGYTLADPSAYDGDSFRLIVPEGLWLSRASVSASLVTTQATPGTLRWNVSGAAPDPRDSFGGSLFVDLLPGGQSTTVPICCESGPVTLTVNFGQIFSDIDSPTNMVASYQFQFDVIDSVPESPGNVLMGVGFALVAWAVRLSASRAGSAPSPR
jgi:hypothetical protein